VAALIDLGEFIANLFSGLPRAAKTDAVIHYMERAPTRSASILAQYLKRAESMGFVLSSGDQPGFHLGSITAQLAFLTNEQWAGPHTPNPAHISGPFENPVVVINQRPDQFYERLSRPNPTHRKYMDVNTWGWSRDAWTGAGGVPGALFGIWPRTQKFTAGQFEIVRLGILSGLVHGGLWNALGTPRGDAIQQLLTRQIGADGKINDARAMLLLHQVKNIPTERLQITIDPKGNIDVSRELVRWFDNQHPDPLEIDPKKCGCDKCFSDGGSNPDPNPDGHLDGGGHDGGSATDGGGGGQHVNVNDNPVFDFSNFFGGLGGLEIGLLVGAGLLIFALLLMR
jgi:hypothetical protein